MAETTKSELKRAWYVLRAISGKEAKVKEILDAAIEKTDLGRYVFQVLIPTEKVVTVRNGKKVVKEKNLSYKEKKEQEAAIRKKNIFLMPNNSWTN